MHYRFGKMSLSYAFTFCMKSVRIYFGTKSSKFSLWSSIYISFPVYKFILLCLMCMYLKNNNLPNCCNCSSHCMAIVGVIIAIISVLTFVAKSLSCSPFFHHRFSCKWSKDIVFVWKASRSASHVVSILAILCYFLKLKCLVTM